MVPLSIVSWCEYIIVNLIYQTMTLSMFLVGLPRRWYSSYTYIMCIVHLIVLFMIADSSNNILNTYDMIMLLIHITNAWLSGICIIGIIGLYYGVEYNID